MLNDKNKKSKIKIKTRSQNKNLKISRGFSNFSKRIVNGRKPKSKSNEIAKLK